MQRWEDVLERFLAPWRGRPDVSAALVYGSRVDGSATDDIDLLVVTRDDDSVPPALCRLDGFLIEAFFPTPARLRAAFEQHHRENSRVTPVQSVTGRILFDRDGAAAALKEEARRWLEKPFALPGEPQRYWMKRSLWHGAQHLRKIHRQGGAEFCWSRSSICTSCTSPTRSALVSR